MKILKVSLLLLIILGLTFSVALAKKHLPEERGKTLFTDPKFAGGSKACIECHPDGKRLRKGCCQERVQK